MNLKFDYALYSPSTGCWMIARNRLGEWIEALTWTEDAAARLATQHNQSGPVRDWKVVQHEVIP